MLSSPSLRSDFVFSIIPLTSFHLAEASLSTFLWLYTLVCVCVYVCVCVCLYVCVSFIYNYLHFWHSFCNQLVLFAQFESVNKL